MQRESSLHTTHCFTQAACKGKVWEGMKILSLVPTPLVACCLPCHVGLWSGVLQTARKESKGIE
eukprot:6468080-Amphidinium_carterae.1